MSSNVMGRLAPFEAACAKPLVPTAQTPPKTNKRTRKRLCMDLPIRVEQQPNSARRKSLHRTCVGRRAHASPTRVQGDPTALNYPHMRDNRSALKISAENPV